MKILEIDHGRLDISVDLHNLGSAHGAWTEEEKTLEARGFRGSLAIGIRALIHSHASEATAQVRTSSELTFPYS
jgi:hypothetical protein